MAHNLKMEVVAEGVETKSQLEFLKAEGVDLIQGYYFSPPLPAEKLETLLRDQNSQSI
ncbi:MAG: EAL domain-containing protein [Gammaproteobacteria bacterium]|nr:EAL domain-containing protein [Gammaproteobacteria bacterium]